MFFLPVFGIGHRSTKKRTQKRVLSKRLKQPFTVKAKVTLVHSSWFSIYNQRRREEIEEKGRKF